MPLEPIGNYLVVRLDPEPTRGTLWLPPKGEIAKRAMVLRSGVPEIPVGARVLVALRQGIQVGDDLLVPLAGVLARFDTAA